MTEILFKKDVKSQVVHPSTLFYLSLSIFFGANISQLIWFTGLRTNVADFDSRDENKTPKHLFFTN